MIPMRMVGALGPLLAVLCPVHMFVSVVYLVISQILGAKLCVQMERRNL